MASRSHLVVLGAGFAALTAVRELRTRAPQTRITVIAPRAEFVYLPSLIWIPTGLREPSELVVPLEKLARQQNLWVNSGSGRAPSA